MRIVPIPLLSDNYAYLVIDEAAKTAAVVDPSEGPPVLARAREEGVTLNAIWCTHHHWDHVGGVEAIADAVPGIAVVGGKYDHEHRRIARQTRAVADGETLGHAGHDFRVLEIPGHTLGAIAFHGGGAVFTGDMLFLAGCGRVFEGTMPMMQSSLEKLRALPGATRVYCGHEYTVKNLEFAASVEPDNAAVAARLEAARSTRQRGAPTVPGTLAEERATNPFLRFDVPAVAAAARNLAGSPGADPFTALREAKDRF